MTRRGPQPIADILGELMARRGFAAQAGGERLQAAWRQAVGEALAGQTFPGELRRGSLQVVVTNNMLIQELTFQKAEILRKLNHQFPDCGVTQLRFRVGKLP